MKTNAACLRTKTADAGLLLVVECNKHIYSSTVQVQFRDNCIYLIEYFHLMLRLLKFTLFMMKIYFLLHYIYLTAIATSHFADERNNSTFWVLDERIETTLISVH